MVNNSSSIQRKPLLRLNIDKMVPPVLPRSSAKPSGIQSLLSFGNPSAKTSPAPSRRASSPTSTALSTFESARINESTFEEDGISTLLQSATPSITSTKSKRKRTSWVYRHMAGDGDMQTTYYNSEGKEVWPCSFCAKSGKKKEYYTSGGTVNIEKHLQKEHSVYEDSPMNKRLQAHQLSIQDAIDSAEYNANKKRKLTEVIEAEKALDGKVIESLFVRWIATNNQALRIVECPEFRAFLTYLNTNVNMWLPNSHTTSGQWVLNQFKIEKERIRLRLHSSRCKIHISLDIWTSPNTLPILGVVAHYISEDNQLESAVLSLTEIQGPHDGDNISLLVEGILEDWGIISKLGYLQMDNASNNDTMIKALGRSKSNSLIPFTMRIYSNIYSPVREVRYAV